MKKIQALKAFREAVIEDEHQELTDNCRENAVYSIEDLIERWKKMSDDYKTADDEEPICIECDFQSDDYHCYRCGPEYGWSAYCRITDFGFDEDEG